MAARDPVRALLGRVVAFAAGVTPDEGVAAVELAEDVRAKVQTGVEVLRRIRGRSSRARIASRVESSRELARVEVVDAEVVDDTERGDGLVVSVVVDPPARRSRYD